MNAIQKKLDKAKASQKKAFERIQEIKAKAATKEAQEATKAKKIAAGKEKKVRGKQAKVADKEAVNVESKPSRAPALIAALDIVEEAEEQSI